MHSIMPDMKDYSESCDQNRWPIFNTIEPLLSDCTSLLEIGSGTGQHAVYFASDLPHLRWQTIDRKENHASIISWLEESKLTNLEMPLELDTRTSDWPGATFDAIFSANTAHIMHWPDVVALFQGVSRVLNPNGLFLLYGPFNYNNEYSSESNANFDQWLKNRDPQSGIKNFQDLDQLASKNHLELVKDFEMPVNNRLLYWKK